MWFKISLLVLVCVMMMVINLGGMLSRFIILQMLF